jgi:transposase-like protein
MSTQRKRSSADLKARVAWEALKGQKTVNEWAGLSGVHPTQIAHGKHRLQKERPEIFSARRAQQEAAQAALQAQLSQQIGHLKVELDWLKKKSWTWLLMPNAAWSSPSIRRSASPGSVIWWG